MHIAVQARRGRTIGVGKGNAHRMDIDRPSSFRRHQGPEVLCRHLSALITGVLSRSIWECRYSARQIISACSSFFSPRFSRSRFFSLSFPSGHAKIPRDDDIGAMCETIVSEQGVSIILTAAFFSLLSLIRFRATMFR